MNISLSELSLVLLVGPSGCGKSTFARRHFAPSEIVSSDFYRAVVCDDESNQAASQAAFELVHHVVATRLNWRRFTVVDATNLQPDSRKPLLELARRHHFLTAALVFDLPEDLCHHHNNQRDRVVPERVIANHSEQLTRTRSQLGKEGYRLLHTFRTIEEVNAAIIQRLPIAEDRRQDNGPFDIIGDVHGCLDELLELLERLGWRVTCQPDVTGRPQWGAIAPPGRKAIFVGDLGDRGPDTPGVYRLVMNLARAGQALCVLGNHDNKLLRKLRGNDVHLTHGLALTLEQLAGESEEFIASIRDYLETLPCHLVLAGGSLVVAHAGLRADLQGRISPRVRSFALFGDTTGETDDRGLPIRRDWAEEYRGRSLVVYGHTPTAEPAWKNNTVNIDTGCVFGGALTALRYPERETVSVPARRQYCEPSRPFLEGE